MTEAASFYDSTNGVAISCSFDSSAKLHFLRNIYLIISWDPLRACLNFFERSLDFLILQHVSVGSCINRNLSIFSQIRRQESSLNRCSYRNIKRETFRFIKSCGDVFLGHLTWYSGFLMSALYFRSCARLSKFLNASWVKKNLNFSYDFGKKIWRFEINWNSFYFIFFA